MEKLNAEKARLDALLADQGVYKEGRKAELTDSLRKQAAVKAELEKVEAEWLDKQSALEAVG